MSITIDIRSAQFTLHPSGAIYWHAQNMILIADVHFGKVAHFRKNGAAIPTAASEENYRKLNDLIQTFNPEKICVGCTSCPLKILWDFRFFSCDITADNITGD